MNFSNIYSFFSKKSTRSKPVYYIFLSIIVVGIGILGFFSFRSHADYPHYENPTQSHFDEYANQLFLSQLSGDALSLHFFLLEPEKMGVANLPVTLGDYSYKSMTATQSGLIHEINTLKSFSYDELLPNQKITYDLILHYFSDQLDFADLCLCSEVLSPTTGLQAQLPVLFSEYKFYTQKDVDNYLTLLSQVNRYFEQICAFQKLKAENNCFLSSSSVDHIVSQCQDFLKEKNAEQNLLYFSFNNKIKSLKRLSSKQKNEYISKNKRILETSILPAYEQIITTLTKLKANGYCKNPNGLYYLKNGQDYYEYLVKNLTGSSKSVLELKAEIQTQIANDLRTLYSLFTVNPEMEEQLYSKTSDILSPQNILEDLEKKSASDFPKLDDISYDIKYVDQSLEDYLSPAFYLSPPIDAPEENVIYINNSQKYQGQDIYTTIAHEGIPGHMYQTNYFANTSPLPIRQLINYGGYTEGWATYVEFMSYNYEYSDSQLARALSCSASYSLALYSLCDIGINYEGWTLEDTKDFLQNYDIEDADVCKTIFQAVIEEPANYLQYYVGYLEILSLKDYVKEQEGTDFDLKKFHKALLTLGPADFDTLKKWILYEYRK